MGRAQERRRCIALAMVQGMPGMPNACHPITTACLLGQTKCGSTTAGAVAVAAADFRRFSPSPCDARPGTIPASLCMRPLHHAHKPRHLLQYREPPSRRTSAAPEAPADDPIRHGRPAAAAGAAGAGDGRRWGRWAGRGSRGSAGRGRGHWASSLARTVAARGTGAQALHSSW